MLPNYVKCTKALTKSHGSFTYHRRVFYDSIQRIVAHKFQKIQVQQQVLIARYLWGIPVTASSLENLLHNYYYELIKLLCDHSTSLLSLSDNFDAEMFDFIVERGSFPGIALFHKYRQHKLSSFDDGFITPQTIQVRVTNLSLKLHIANHVTHNDEYINNHNANVNAYEQDNEDMDVAALRNRLSKLYKNKDALEEALEKLNIDNKESEKSSKTLKTKLKSVDKMQFDQQSMNEEAMAVYLQSAIYIYHGNENDDIDDVINNKRFEPNLVSDFIDINAADWNRLFHWKLITRTPVGYIECNDNCDKLKISLDKILSTSQDTEFMNVLNCYRASQQFRLQSTNNISLWKVIEANEATL